MFSIAGVISQDKKATGKLLIKMMQVLAQRRDQRVGICIEREISYANRIDDLDLSNLEGTKGIGGIWFRDSNEPLRKEQPVLGDKGSAIVFNGQIYNQHEICHQVPCCHKNGWTDVEAILYLFEEHLKQTTLIQAMRQTLEKLDGIYAFAILNRGKILITRDPIGVKALYLGKTEEIFAFASERKALWSLGIQHPTLVNPSQIIILDPKSIQQHSSGLELKRTLPTTITLDNAREKLRKLLYNAIKKLIGIGEIGILFSGGLDSSILAKIGKDLEADIALYCAGFSNSKDLINARHSAVTLDLPIHIVQLDLDTVESVLPQILTALEEPHPMNLAIAIPFFFATQLAKREGKVIVLCGQGADESLGGYRRYVDILEMEGYTELHTRLQNDVINLSIGLQRECVISTTTHIEFGFPYLDRTMLQFLLQLPAEYKIFKDDSNYIRKHILRLVAKDLGLPAQIYERPKLAAQFGAGTHKALDALAVKNGFTRLLSRKYGYQSRIQMYVDFLGYNIGIPIPEQRKINLLQFLKNRR